MRASLGMVRNPFTVPGVPSVTIRRSVNVTVYLCSFSAPFMAQPSFVAQAFKRQAQRRGDLSRHLVNREACGVRKVDHENGSGACPIGIHGESVLEGDGIKNRSHLNLQMLQLRFRLRSPAWCPPGSAVGG